MVSKNAKAVAQIFNLHANISKQYADRCVAANSRIAQYIAVFPSGATDYYVDLFSVLFSKEQQTVRVIVDTCQALAAATITRGKGGSIDPLGSGRSPWIPKYLKVILRLS
ncbi:unnamed protein product [Didymodactylos carnosus]|uniref:Uncharacterized protein n=1 Tax=Didymodactylos carnosus TaxID=1234261 RepID=A0A8S2FI01_9BILA|nr:unnamed protein product [Didymodactylos carnosus]CAF4253986.1 unnamed protein product [Didymodactylos carnosus]